MIIQIRPNCSNHYLLSRIGDGINRIAKSKGQKELMYTRKLNDRIKQMERAGIRGTMTPTGIKLAETGDLAPRELLEAIRARAVEVALSFIKDGNVVANDNQIRICDHVLAGRRVGWINVQNIFVEYGPTFTVEVELP